MSKVLIEESTLTSIANAIREKTATSSPIQVSNMNTMILNIEAGGGGESIPDEALLLQHTCDYMFFNNNFSWFLRDYGNKITTQNLGSTNCMFQGCQADRIPFALNFKECNSGNWHNCVQMFSGCSWLTELPEINNLTMLQGTQLFMSCNRLRELPYRNLNFSTVDNWGDPWTPSYSQMFNGCHSLRDIDPIWIHQPTKCAAYSNLFYYGFTYCDSLDELVDVPFPESLRLDYDNDPDNECYWDGNGFETTFDWCARLKRLKFKQYPVGLKMTNQVIDLSRNAGWSTQEYSWRITGFNSGITYHYAVNDADAYNTFKDSENWYTESVEFSRYNKTSAEETIHSLPDTSQFISEWGGTNTIMFRGDAGSSTDGGAISDLSPEIIQEAADKGWTVSFT